MSGLSDYTPPQYAYDLLAERSLLQVALGGDPLALQLCGELVPKFWDQRNALLARVLSGMQAQGQHVDSVTAMGQILAQGHVSKLPGPFLHSVLSGPGDHSGVMWYAGRIREMAARRSLTECTTRFMQRMEFGWATGEDAAVTSALTQFRTECDAIEQTIHGDEAGSVQSLAEFLDGPTEEDWLVPGLLERNERMILTGGEGHGKSVLVSQMGACMAGSVHPFSGAVLGGGNHGIRVTVVDCENSAVQSRRRWRRIINQVDRARTDRGFDRVDWKQQVSIDIRPEGINLLSDRDVSLLEHIVSSTRPDLLVLGPLYKIFDEDPSNERAVRRVAAVLDGLRARHRFALLMEAHPGKGEGADGARRMAPIGSSLWLRWPEYGFGLRRARAAKAKRPELVDVVSWRGTREERSWPHQLRHSRMLPWEPVTDQRTSAEDRAAELYPFDEDDEQ